MTDWIGETFTSFAGWNHLETLVDIENRMAGSDGERRAAEATRDALSDVGARNARLDEFEIQGWTRGESTVRMDETRAGGHADHASIALPRSPNGSATGELIDLGYGLPEDFEENDIDGNVVMAASDVPDYYDRFIHRTEKYHHAVAGGAVAFVFRNHVPGQLPPTGSVSGAESPIGEIPAVGVSKEVGTRVARRFEGEPATVEVDAEIHDARSQNIHAELGPDTSQRVLVTSHVDAHDIAEGAGDNGAGTGMVLELARALHSREDELDTTVEFVVFGAEEVGLCGSEYMAEHTDFDGIKAVLNNDGVVRGRTLSLLTHGFSELETAAEQVSERFDHPIEVVPKQGPHSDHWPFVRWGVPGYHATSDTGETGRGWGHTHADTLDKLESRTLREQAILLTDLAVTLTDEEFEIPPKEPEEIAAALEREGGAEGMKITGDWPY